jgi:hypothetical protein
MVPRRKGKALSSQWLLNPFAACGFFAVPSVWVSEHQGFRLRPWSVRQASPWPARFRSISVNVIPPDDSKEKANRRRLILIGFALAAISLFMYVSFILKTAIKGP